MRKEEPTIDELREYVNKIQILHEHRYYPNSRTKSDVCIICGYDPKFKELTNGNK